MIDAAAQRNVTLITADHLDCTDTNLAKLISFVGLEYSLLPFDRSGDDAGWLASQLQGNQCLMINAASLKGTSPGSQRMQELGNLIDATASHAFMYNVSADADITGAVRHLTAGTVHNITTVKSEDLTYTVTGGHRSICRQMSGLSFERGHAGIDHLSAFEHHAGGAVDLVSINGKPLFIMFRRGPCEFFLLGSRRIIDIDERLPGRFNVQEYFMETVPVMLFLRYVFRERCWHRNENYASFIIDDPLLRERYGFVHYRTLLKEMDAHNFHSNIAFIPWNRRRTHDSAARLFAERPDRFSICIHGCDHLHNEFGIRDERELGRISRLAVARMEDHRARYGVAYDNVMVFPQGNFSSPAMKVLKENNYLAAVNSRLRPTDGTDGFSVSSLLETALMDYHGFPLFLRRYPKDLIESAFELFLGKPVLIVLHHDSFRDGYEPIRAFASGINSLDPNVVWDSPGKIIARTYVERVAPDGTMHARMYANRCIVRNDSGDTRKFHIEKYEGDSVPIGSVFLNDNVITYDLINRTLRITIEIPPHGAAALTIRYQGPEPAVTEQLQPLRELQIASRRYCSEFRDNIVSRNRFLLSMASRLVHIKNKPVQSK